MKNLCLKGFLIASVFTSSFFASCQSDDSKSNNGNSGGNSGGNIEIPDQSDFDGLKEIALLKRAQKFVFNIEDGLVSFTSESGVTITLDAGLLNRGGNAVTGEVELLFLELFNRGDMLTTDKPTMGILPNGGKALLISGGEFFMEITKDGQGLDTTGKIELEIPTELTGGVDEEMTLWEGGFDDQGNLEWEEDDICKDPMSLACEGAFVKEDDTYKVSLSDFGWANVDRFYSDPRPKTTLQVKVPEGYNYDNSSVYLSYQDLRNALAKLDTYNDSLELFSEHYGQIPIGLECDVIFVTEHDGDWRYAVKSVTIEDGEIITITMDETTVGSEEQLTQIINNLP